MSDLHRLLALVTKEPGDGCWHRPDRRGCDELGYWKFRLNRKPVKAHRASYILHHGEIPAGMLVCHRCDNPSCIRPDHLFLGTSSDNAQDRENKGRGAINTRRGMDCATSKLTDENVRQIRSLRSSGRTLSSIAVQFDISVSNASLICLGQTWKHVGAA